MTNKDKCKELREIRAKMAKNIGIDLHQRECTYEGECSGTCPKCKAEELQLNAALLKRKAVMAGAVTVAAVTLTACQTPTEEVILSGDVVQIEEPINNNIPEEDNLDIQNSAGNNEDNNIPIDDLLTAGDIAYIGEDENICIDTENDCNVENEKDAEDVNNTETEKIIIDDALSGSIEKRPNDFLDNLKDKISDIIE